MKGLKSYTPRKWGRSPKSSSSPLVFWNTRPCTYLASIAIRISSIPPTACSLERTQSNIHDHEKKKRSRLSHPALFKESFISNNIKVIIKPPNLLTLKKSQSNRQAQFVRRLTCRAKKTLLSVVFFETKPHLLRFLYGTTSKTTGGSVYLALSVVIVGFQIDS